MWERGIGEERTVSAFASYGLAFLLWVRCDGLVENKGGIERHLKLGRELVV